MCKRFLWKGDAQSKGKALIAWDTLCWHNVVGGLNITDVYIWNKAAILKHLWNLAQKKDKLWIVRVHTYYIKGRRPWEVAGQQASWMVRKIIQAGHWISEAGIPMTEIMDADDFTIKGMHKKLRGDFIKVPWRRLTCINQGNSKWIFILYLTIHRRLYTMDRLDKWGIHTDQVCALCKQELETHQHLFFSCTMAARI
ncbi:hypothetical protein R3W88_011741 [Solanum pinnatisectum]|uniref:Reverse transcriptase zinc-binding domain-containing protein n=1 Tax=Solanum pinnatisectum TaxID=50273 RepID=A0AAV9L7Q2_9SOLN|nr:hypothetical protein R3W88_011741 [Solanum pinnatisectum]